MVPKLTALCFVWIALSTVSGCAANRPSPLSFTVRRIPDADRDRAFEQARTVLRAHGFRIEKSEPQSGRLMTYPVDAPEPGRAREGLRDRPSRQIAEIRVNSEDGQTSIYCRVFQLRQTTEAHRLLSVEQSADDRPARTPIEREGATDRRHNVVWETVGRNKSRERAVLADILSGLGATTAPTP